MTRQNYPIKLLRLESESKLPPGLWHADIRHDDWCGIFRGRHCDCDPDIAIVDDAMWQARNLQKHRGED